MKPIPPEEEQELKELACIRARANFSNAKSFLKAAIRGFVDSETQRERIATCEHCSFLCSDDKGTFCGCCGCATGKLSGRLVRLTKYAETPEDRLCRHPYRATGKGWKK
jgi:hypothetical protein